MFFYVFAGEIEMLYVIDDSLALMNTYLSFKDIQNVKWQWLF